MKNLILILLLMPSLVFAGPTLEWNATFVPPHHEPVVGDKVARYRLQVIPGYEMEYFRISLQLDAWGVQTWQPSSVVGHNWQAYENSDWSVEEWRLGTTTRAEAGPDKLHFYTEYYMPIDRKTWGGHGMERHYYWLVGFGGRYQ
jgi:hypothetical protein